MLKTKIDITNFATQTIEAMGLTDLPVSRRKILRAQLEEMLMSRIINTLLSHLDEDHKEKLTEQMESTNNMDEFFVTLFHNVPNSQEIITEETELLFEKLTSNG